ncbi:MAG: glycosyltransferase family 2 protein [Lachnospiraceae bacterium]|nr:glycosyltransferase family 2 protein [Lachnospiraceae bacterium]
MKPGRLKTYLKDHGAAGGMALLFDRILQREVPEVPYEAWQRQHTPSSGDLRRMSGTHLLRNPLIGVRALIDRPCRAAFMRSLDSQIYRNFKPVKRADNAEYILMVHGSCTLRPDLLWRCAAMLGDGGPNTVDLIYFDSDIIDSDGVRKQPAFRAEYDPYLLERVNYMGSVVLVRAERALEAGLPGATDASFHDFLKRVCFGTGDMAPSGREAVRHISEILYHTSGVYSDRSAGDVSPYAYQSCDPAYADCPSDVPDTQRRNIYEAVQAGSGSPEKKGRDPLISVLIPNKDHAEDLERCVDSLIRVNTWKNLEVLIIENNSELEETFALYRRLEERDGRIRVIRWDGAFNYAAINNYGASLARGGYLLLLNNDTRILDPDSIARMFSLASRPSVGAAGALLLYPDGSVQHAGIILGYGGIAGHAWEKERPWETSGEYPRLVFSHIHSSSAVTGACMMLRRSVWQMAGGMDESLEVTFNDVDLCMRIRNECLDVVVHPGACLMHYESSSRGGEDTPQKVSRFHREIRIFVRRWEKKLEMGDPFYSPCLTLLGRSWTCRDDIREKGRPYLKYLHMEEELQ